MKQYPYLEDPGEGYNFYWVRYSPTFCHGRANKFCHVADAEWMREAWYHELQWDTNNRTLAHEILISKFLLESKVYPGE